MTRTDIINALIQKYNYSAYLEIGVQHGKNFHAVKCPHKVGVDPDPNSKATIHLKSDDFFSNNKEKFDIVMVDGLHHSEQVYKDIINSLNVLNKGGAIVVHDCNPTSELTQRVPRESKEWYGDVYKAFSRIRIEFQHIKDIFTINTDCGCGVIHYDGNILSTGRYWGEATSKEWMDKLTYEEFDKNRKELLNLISVEEFKKNIDLNDAEKIVGLISDEEVHMSNNFSLFNFSDYKKNEEYLYKQIQDKWNKNKENINFKKPNIYHFQPGNSEKNLGKAYNEHCKLVPNDNDWICLYDFDTMVLTPLFYELLEDSISKGYDVYTSYTNRTKNQKQLYPGISEISDLRELRDLAVKTYWANKGKIKEVKGDLSGHFLMFKKSLWNEIGGFPETEQFKGKGTIIGVDTWFSRKIKDKKIGLIEGFLLIHYYRFNEGIDYKEHLK